MESIVELWNRAQELESRESRDEARSVYEAILAREPYHTPARLRMSRLEQLADRYGASKEHALFAADAVSTQSATRNMGYVTARLLEFSEEERAAALITSADPADPNVIRQSPALAQQLWLAGKYNEALRFLDAMKKHVSVHPLLTFTRANVLRFLGDMEGAEQEYEATLRMSPDMADAHWALSTHSKSQPPRARIPRIQSALSRSKDGTIEQAHLCYALFREFDAAGDVNEAWFSLKLGAHIMKQRLHYDGSQEAQLLRSWMQEIEQGPDVARVGESGPIFIVGMPRTGTTLLDRILSNHPDIESLGERNDFSAAVSEASDCFFDTLLKTARDGVLQRLDFDRAGKLYLARLRRAPGSSRFVIDKNPKNLFNIPLILRAIPNARVLCLMRDPTDSCFSNLKELFQGGAYPYSYALDDLAEHCMLAHDWIRYWAAAAPSAVRVVRYEELVANPDQVIEPLLPFIGADFHSGLTNIESNAAPVSTASSSQVRESIHGRGVGAWARYEKHLQPLRERLAQLSERVDN